MFGNENQSSFLYNTLRRYIPYCETYILGEDSLLSYKENIFSQTLVWFFVYCFAQEVSYFILHIWIMLLVS